MRGLPLAFQKLFFLVLLFSFSAYSQSSTRGEKTSNVIDKKNNEIILPHHIMLIPFEPKLYMSEIDKAINKETKMKKQKKEKV